MKADCNHSNRLRTTGNVSSAVTGGATAAEDWMSPLEDVGKMLAKHYSFCKRKLTPLAWISSPPEAPLCIRIITKNPIRLYQYTDEVGIYFSIYLVYIPTSDEVGLYRSNQLIEPILMLDLRWFRPNINKNYVCFWYLYILSVPDVWFHFYQFL